MSNGAQVQNPTTTMTITGLSSSVSYVGKYPNSVTLGQGGFPGPEDGPKAVPPGAAFSLPTLVFGGPWQPYKIPNVIQPG